MIASALSCSSSDDSEPEVIKSKVQITRIEIPTIPLDNGSNWDVGSNPDLFIKMHDHTSASPQLESPTVWNINLTPPNVFYCTLPPNESSDLVNASLTVQAFDDDSDDALAGADDFIGEITFRISDYTSGSNKYPPFVTKSVNGLIVIVYFTWKD